MKFFLQKNRIDYNVKVEMLKIESVNKRVFNWNIYTVGRLSIDTLGEKYPRDRGCKDSLQFSLLVDRFYEKNNTDNY